MTGGNAAVCRIGIKLLILTCAGFFSVVSKAQSGTPAASRFQTGKTAKETTLGADARAFDVFSIRTSKPGDHNFFMKWGGPDGYSSKGQSLLSLLLLAYFSPSMSFTPTAESRISGAPDWVKNTHYDIEAKVAPEDVAAWQEQGVDKKLLQAMLQSALADRCKLVAHRATAEGKAYALVVSKPSAKLKRTQEGVSFPSTAVRLMGGGMMVPYQRGASPTVTYYGTSMSEFAAHLSGSSSLTVVDRTGLAGRYDFPLSKRDTTGEQASDPDPATVWDIGELGLKLVPIKTAVDTVVIDHIEKPSEN